MQTADDCTKILETAIAPNGSQPPVAAVVGALLQTEKATKQNRQQFPVESLMGCWRLFFVTRGKVKQGDQRLRGFYLPSWIPAQIQFQPSESDESPIAITNQITIGLVRLKLSGPAKYSEPKNILGFDFTQLEVKILGQTVYRGKFPSPRAEKVFADIAIGKLPFFAFFTVNQQFIAARGRGGGLAIWVKA